MDEYKKIRPKTYVRLNSHGSSRFYLKKSYYELQNNCRWTINLLMDEYKIFIRLLLVNSRMLSFFQMLSLLERMSGDGGKQKKEKKPNTVLFHIASCGVWTHACHSTGDLKSPPLDHSGKLAHTSRLSFLNNFNTLKTIQTCAFCIALMVKIRVRFRNSGLGFEEQEWERERRNKFVAWFLFEGESEGRS